MNREEEEKEIDRKEIRKTEEKKIKRSEEEAHCGLVFPLVYDGELSGTRESYYHDMQIELVWCRGMMRARGELNE